MGKHLHASNYSSRNVRAMRPASLKLTFHLDTQWGQSFGAFWSSPTIITQAPWRRAITAAGHHFTAACRGGITNSV